MSSWQVKEGDEIAAGDVLAEIETDMATLVLENKVALISKAGLAVKRISCGR